MAEFLTAKTDPWSSRKTQALVSCAVSKFRRLRILCLYFRHSQR